MNKEDINFLMELQKEMNTEDKCLTASPRYYGIMSPVKQWRRDGSGNYVVIRDIYEGNTFEFYEFIDELCLEYEEFDLNEIYEIDEGIEQFNEILDYMDSNPLDFSGFDCDRYELMSYDWEDELNYDCLFLTRKDAKLHLEQNSHNYPSGSYTYCLHAWRSPRIEKLYKILRETDWRELL